MAAPGKPYGLIFPKKAQQKTFVKHAVFMDESDEESSVGESLQREAVKKQAMKQTKLEIQRALEEDSTVYEYDNIYDDIQQKKAESQASLLAGKGEKKPKYIQNILKAAELRKKEQEKRMEKKIQKEREMEGNAFDDKEAFVTSAYKKKLQERAEEEEREKREAEIEACLDVTKQKDLSGFYRHLLNQAVGEEATPQCSLREARLKEEEPDENPRGAKQGRRSSDEQTRPRVPSKETGNPDADSDSETESSDEESGAKVHTDGRANDKKETGRGSLDHSGDVSKHRKRQRDSRSSSEEEKKPLLKTAPGRQEGGRRGKSGRHRERDGDGRHHEKEERLRTEGGRRRKEERDDRQRKKDRKERDEYDRDLKRERDKEDRYSQWEQQMKERQANHRGQPREGEKGREGKRERKNSSPQSEEEEEEEEEEEDGQDQKGGVGRGKETPSESKELKRKTSQEEEEEAEQAAKPPDRENRFAKRSSQETVMSARDRYLARQMARMGTKSYLEKEED